MFTAVFQSEKTIKEKIDELKTFCSHPDFLTVLRNPKDFLEELVPFATQVFKEIPADSSMSFGPDNEMRVFCIRLLSKFDYKGCNTHMLLEMIYNLFATENIFNRYLTLKILFPLLDSDILIDSNIHLKVINTFFKIELPTSENHDNSRRKLGFFSAAEALNYLKYFQTRFNLSMEAYEEILYSLTGAFKVYFVQRYIEEFYHNKKISCEFCSFGINFFEFINKLNIPTAHYIIPFIPELCYTLCNMCPRDCVLLQCEILDTIMNTFSIRKDILFNLDKYFLKNSYLVTDSPFLKIKNLTFMSNLMRDSSRNMSKIVFSEFDSRICEYIPLHKDVPLLTACIEALTFNLIAALKYPLEPIDLKMLIIKHIKTANKIYRRLHLPYSCQYSDTPTEIKTDESADLKFFSYLKVFIKALTTVQIPKPLDWDDILILGQLLLFPLTREIPCVEYLALFNELPIDVLETILLPIIDELMVHFYLQIFSWSILMKIPEIFSLFIKAANVLIHKDFTTSKFHSIDFYTKIFPICYGFFKIDKRFAKPECSELFSFIFDSFLKFDPSHYPSALFDTKSAVNLINSMFLDIKSCEIVYTGLYFIYDTFESTVNELYTLYTLSFDSFYLECLFNIPVSLNLLVTKYSILVPPMTAGLRSSKKLREIIMKYVEYIIEFDTEDSGMEDLLILIYDLLQEHSLKSINVLSRISNKHREALTSGELRGHRIRKNDKLNIKSPICKIENSDLSFLEENSLEKSEISETINKALNPNINTSEWIDPKKPIGAESDYYVKVDCDELKRISIPALTGYEFSYEASIKRLPYCNSSSRTLKGVGTTAEAAETARAVLIDYVLRLLKIENLFSSDSLHLIETSTVLQSLSDTSFALLLDDHSSSFETLKLICKNIPIEFLCEFITDGYLYAQERAAALFKYLIQERSNDPQFSKFMARIIYGLLGSIYSTDDLRSHRSFDSLCFLLNQIPCHLFPNEITVARDCLHTVFYKLKNCVSLRIYKLALSICFSIFDKSNLLFTTFDKLFEKLSKTQQPYLRALLFELRTVYNIPMNPEVLPELDKQCFVRIFQCPKNAILKIENLPILCESFLKSINKKDNISIMKFIALLDKIRTEEVLFTELLTPVKKYLPPIAVLEGFNSLEARRKFVENVNRNGNFQIQNPNSLKVFRNLFFDCKINGSIKSSVIEFLNSSGSDHRAYLLEILLNCTEYDLPSFDFLITKLGEFPLLDVSHILGLSHQAIHIFETLYYRINQQPDHIKEALLIYLIERMNNSFIYNFVEYCIPISTKISHILTNFLNDFLSNTHSLRDQYTFSKSAYNILRYLKKKKCRFNDNKAVLIVYKDLHGIELEIDDLVNWYFKNFSPEDIEVLFRINSCFLITSSSLVIKLASVESTSTRNWMLNCLKKHLGGVKYSCVNHPPFIDPKYDELISHCPYLENSRLSDCNGFLHKCLASYLRFKGLSIPEKGDSKPIEFIKNLQEMSINLENDSDDLNDFDSLCSSATDVSLFIDDDRNDNNEIVELFEDNSVNKIGHRSQPGISYIKRDSSNTFNHSAPSQSNRNNTLFTGKANVPETISAINRAKLNAKPSEYPNIAIEEAIIKNSNPTTDECYAVTLKDLSSVLPLFYESISVIIELFCDLRIYSQELVQFCLSTPQASYRFASLFYLSMFSPQVDFFDEIFKLNYQESKYVFNSLKLLVDKFGTEPFIEPVKTVLRSEMRIKSSEVILIPLLLAEPKFFEDKEILFEVCVLTKRLLSKGIINYPLINFLNSTAISLSFKEDINTQIILLEITNRKQELFITSVYDRRAVQMTMDSKIFTLLENDLCDRYDDSKQNEKERFVQMVDQSFTFNNGVFVKEKINGFDRNVMIKIFLENPLITLSKNVIQFLKLSPSAFLTSTLETQMNMLEIIADKEQPIVDSDLVIRYLNNLVHFKYPNLQRFNAVYPRLIKAFSLIEWLIPLLVDNEFVYPPLFEFLPEIFEICSPEIAVSLCSKRPANIPIDTVEFNTFHLFKILPFSLDPLKLDFFNGLLSKNKLTRKAYLDLFMSHVPNTLFASLQFIFLFNYNGLDEFHSEYIIMAILYKNLIKTNEIHCQIKDNGYCNNTFTSEIYHSFLNSVPSISDLIILNKDSPSSVISNYCSLVESLACSLLSLLFKDNIITLYRVFNENFNRSFRIKLPFYKAFISNGMAVSDFIFNPYLPSLKFYQLSDRELYLGLIKAKGSIREIKNIVKSIEENDENETLNLIFDLFRKVVHRQVSFNMEDIDFVENEIKRIYLDNGIPYFSIFKDRSIEVSDRLKTTASPYFNSSYTLTEVDQIELRFKKVLEGLENDRNILEDVKNLVNSLSLMSFIPRNTLLLSKLLMFSCVTSEIVESSIILKDNLTDSIFGRFRMWMNRYPSFISSFIDWNLFMKWRMFIFNKAMGLVPENDKKRISTEICKLNCIYSSKAFKDKLYCRSSAILNEVSSLSSIEINQNMQRTLLDLENLFNMKEYTTMVSLINSLNITKFSNEEKSRLYYWIYKALKKLGKNAESEKYGTLSRKLSEIIENKKDDLEILKERMQFRPSQDNQIDENLNGTGFFSLFPSMSTAELENSIVSKLIEIINEVSIEESRIYMMELLKYPQIPFEQISHRKLYFFIPQIKNIDFLISKNPLLRTSIESIEIFSNLYSHKDNKRNDNNFKSTEDKADTADNINLNIQKSILENLMNQKIPDIQRIRNFSNSVVSQQIRDAFSCSFSSSLLFFEKDTALPGEFSILRSKYDDIKIMEYVECTDSSFSKETFFVRNSDGSLYKIIGEIKNTDFSLGSKYFQFFQFYFDILKNFNFEKLGTKFSVIPTFISNNCHNINDEHKAIHFSVHKNADCSVDLLLKIQAFKSKLSPETLLIDYFNECLSHPPLIALCHSISKFKNLLRDQIIDTAVDYNDFYTFKRNFINSYSPFMFLQYLLNLNNISLEDTYLDQSGNCYLSAISSKKEKLYLRPNFQMIFGSEGINGPLYRTYSEFMSVCNSELAIEAFVFFGMGNANDLKKKISQNVSKDENFINLIISDSIDPKTGVTLSCSQYPWL